MGIKREIWNHTHITVWRDVLGHFISWHKWTPEYPISELKEIIKEYKIPSIEPTYYLHLISFNYPSKTRGKRGFHPFYIEAQVLSADKLTKEECYDYVLENAGDFYQPIAGSIAKGETKLKGIEIRVGLMPTVKVKLLEHTVKR